MQTTKEENTYEHKGSLFFNEADWLKYTNAITKRTRLPHVVANLVAKHTHTLTHTHTHTHTHAHTHTNTHTSAVTQRTHGNGDGEMEKYDEKL